MLESGQVCENLPYGWLFDQLLTWCWFYKICSNYFFICPPLWKKDTFKLGSSLVKKLSTNFRKSSGFLIFHTIVCRFPSVGNTPHWIAWEWRGVRKPPLWLAFCPVTDLMLILKICSNYFFICPPLWANKGRISQSIFSILVWIQMNEWNQCLSTLLFT